MWTKTFILDAINRLTALDFLIGGDFCRVGLFFLFCFFLTVGLFLMVNKLALKSNSPIEKNKEIFISKTWLLHSKEL